MGVWGVLGVGGGSCCSRFQSLLGAHFECLVFFFLNERAQVPTIAPVLFFLQSVSRWTRLCTSSYPDLQSVVNGRKMSIENFVVWRRNTGVGFGMSRRKTAATAWNFAFGEMGWKKSFSQLPRSIDMKRFVRTNRSLQKDGSSEGWKRDENLKLSFFVSSCCDRSYFKRFGGGGI